MAAPLQYSLADEASPMQVVAPRPGMDVVCRGWSEHVQGGRSAPIVLVRLCGGCGPEGDGSCTCCCGTGGAAVLRPRMSVFFILLALFSLNKM